MRTTLTLDDDVQARLEREARREGKSFQEVVNYYLRWGLTAHQAYHTMSRHRCVLLWILLSVGMVAPARAEERSLFVLFGSTGEVDGGSAAQAVAASAQHWLRSSGAQLEVRRPGASEGQGLTKAMDIPYLQKAFADAGRASRTVDSLSFLNTLDKSTYALARQPGKRMLLVIVDSGVLASADIRGGLEEVQNRIGQTLDFCKSKSVMVMVLDVNSKANNLSPTLESLASGTGGALVHDPAALDNRIFQLLPEPVEPAAAPASSSTGSSGAGAIHLRMVRTLPNRKQPGSDLGPMNGFFLVEAPFRDFEFQKDDRAGSYLARARVTAVIRRSDGKIAWQAKKEIQVKGPLRTLSERLTGSLLFMRQVQIPGGQYSLEAVVDDLVAGKSKSASEPLQSQESVPGFDVSDGMIVRKLNDAADKFDADQVLAYDGKALAPMLAPVYPANQPVDLQLYVILYPDVRGGEPDLNLEILRGSQVVGHSHLSFSDRVRNTATDGSTMDMKGEQKHEFPYLAAIVGAMFEAGDYEAHLIVRQDKRTITRSVKFHVAGAP